MRRTPFVIEAQTFSQTASISASMSEWDSQRFSKRWSSFGVFSLFTHCITYFYDVSDVSDHNSRRRASCLIPQAVLGKLAFTFKHKVMRFKWKDSAFYGLFDLTSNRFVYIAVIWWVCIYRLADGLRTSLYCHSFPSCLLFRLFISLLPFWFCVLN
jgi:hypothetical protein